MVLFDLLAAQPASDGSKFHGGGEYIKTVLKKMIDLGYSSKLVVFYNYSSFLDEWLKEILCKNNVKTIDVKKYEELDKIFFNDSIDTFYSGMPYFGQIRNIPTGVRIIGTMHGLRRLELPVDKFSYLFLNGKSSIKERIRYIVSRTSYKNTVEKKSKESYLLSLSGCQEIVCVSYHTKYAIENFFPENSKYVNVFYTPAKYVEKEFEIGHKPLVKDKYILLIGLNRWEKNGYRALLAIEKLFSQNRLSDYKIVTVGKLPSKIEKRFHRMNKLIKFGYVEPDELENLYANCDFFLYPTLNEGFGMPPLEAMKYGKTCVVSAVCSVPEVCGDAAYYFNPYDINEMCNRILMACDNKINPGKVKKHFSTIKQKQDNDLVDLCKYIVG